MTQIAEMAYRHAVGIYRADNVLAPLGSAAGVVVRCESAKRDSAMSLLSWPLYDDRIAGDHLHVIVVGVGMAYHHEIGRFLQRPVRYGAAESARLIGIGDDLDTVRGRDQK